MSDFLARKFADFANTVAGASIPPAVRAAAWWHVIDSIGVSIAGAAPEEESGQAARQLADEWHTSQGSTILGVGSKVRPELAALMNGSLAQALEMDDKHGSSLARPGSTVIPAILALAEARGSTIEDAVTSVVVGYEVMIRLGFVAGDRFLERGYHTSSLLGSFGVAAAAGNLLGCTPEQIVHAQGISGTFASGIQESTRTGSTSKILHGGWGAHAGILAIDLARAGITGPESVYEGKMGFFQTHLMPITGELDWRTGGKELGSHWFLPDTAYKPYPCCQLLHAFIDAGKTLLAQMKQDGVTLDQITRIHGELAEPGLTLVTDPLEDKKVPRTPHAARFSLPFTVSSLLVHGDVGLESFRPDRLSEKPVLDLAQKVTVAEDLESDYPMHCPARLTIEAGGKEYFEHVPFHPGCPEAPLSQDDVLDKFERNTKWYFGAAARDIAAKMADLPVSMPLSKAIADLNAQAVPRAG